MAKVTAPLLSHRAQGSLGKKITYSDWKKIRVVKSIPTHPDAMTWPQLRQRWFYTLAKTMWHSLTPASKANWETLARPLRITGFNYFMREWLNGSQRWDLAAPLEEGETSITEDYSPNHYPGTLYGPTWTRLTHVWSLLFDGTDDYLHFQSTPNLRYTSEDFSIVVRLYRTKDLLEQNVISNGDYNIRGYNLIISNTNTLVFRTNQAAAAQFTSSSVGAVLQNTWHTLIVTRSGPEAHIYIDLFEDTATPGVHINPVAGNPGVIVGAYNLVPTLTFGGQIESVWFCDFTLNASQAREIHRYLERRQLGNKNQP